MSFFCVKYQVQLYTEKTKLQVFSTKYMEFEGVTRPSMNPIKSKTKITVVHLLVDLSK